MLEVRSSVRPSVRQPVLASSNPVLGFDFNTIIRGWQFVLPKVFLFFVESSSNLFSYAGG